MLELRGVSVGDYSIWQGESNLLRQRGQGERQGEVAAEM